VAIDQGKSDAFAARMMEMLNTSGLAMMISMGHRVGLFDTMSRLPAMTSGRLAEEAGLSERYVREWLGAMTCGRIVEHDAAAQTYRLPAEHTAWLTRAASPKNLAASMQWVAVLGDVEGEVAEAFRHGRGVPYSSYDRFHDVMAEESGQSVVAALDEHILPLVPELKSWLADGIDVLDVGCGAGRILMKLAEMFPKSRFVGYDISDVALDAAAKEARSRGLSNVRFERKDAAEMMDRAAFDLITTFDAIHDQARPGQVLANIRRALGSGGVYLCQEIKGESDHAGNLGHPLAPFLYTVSTMHCMSVSLANGGPGLGAMWGRQTCRRMLAQAGFDDVTMHELPHDIMNDWYVCLASD
jgi:ubiquinone/menaquinone biosynthesis C-methylase UbiE